MDKIELVTQQLHSITRSYAKKINLSNYVPDKQYESLDLFSSHNEQLPQSATQEEITALSDRLFNMAKAEVEARATEVINELKRAAGITIEPTGAEYAQVADIITMLESAVVSENIKSAVELVKERKDTLNEVQLEFLRSVVRKAEAKILK